MDKEIRVLVVDDEPRICHLILMFLFRKAMWLI